MLLLSRSSLLSFSASKDLKYLFFLRQDSNADNTLFAFDLDSQELKSIVLEKEGYRLANLTRDESGNMVLTYEKKDADVSDTHRNHTIRMGRHWKPCSVMRRRCP